MSAPRRTYRAVWNGAVLAESDRTVQVEGNQYFPPESVNTGFLRPSTHTSVCPWKGTANYCTVEAEGKTNRDAAWYYPDPSPAAGRIRDHVAFWKGVRVVEVDGPDTVPGPAKGILARILGRG